MNEVFVWVVNLFKFKARSRNPKTRIVCLKQRAYRLFRVLWMPVPLYGAILDKCD